MLVVTLVPKDAQHVNKILTCAIFIFHYLKIFVNFKSFFFAVMGSVKQQTIRIVLQTAIVTVALVIAMDATVIVDDLYIEVFLKCINFIFDKIIVIVIRRNSEAPKSYTSQKDYRVEP